MTIHTNIDDAPDAVDVHAGQRLRDIRKARGFSQEKLAEAVGITFQQIQKYERGANRISLSRAFHMSRALQCSVADFFSDLPQEWENGELPASVAPWSLTERGVRWAQAGQALAPEDFNAVLEVVIMLGRR